MKFNHLVFTLLGAAALLVACTEDPYMPSPGDNTHNQDSIYVAPDTPIPDSLLTIISELPQEQTYNVHEICALGKELGPGNTVSGTYYIYGWVTGLHSGHADAMAGSYGNGQFYISANKDGLQKDSFYAYHILGRDNKKFANVDGVAIGDFVIVKTTKITNYSGTIENPNNSAYVWFSTNPLW